VDTNLSEGYDQAFVTAGKEYVTVMGENDIFYVCMMYYPAMFHPDGMVPSEPCLHLLGIMYI
jgi:hypothetical protein